MSSVWREGKRAEAIHVATRLALAGITGVAALAVSCAVTDAGTPVNHQPTIDSDVRAVTKRGSARVLVELSVGEADAASRPRLIEAAQDVLLQRLGSAGARMVRRYTTVPLLALEIDAAALARLEAMSDLVSRVRLDTMARPSTWRAHESWPG